MWNKVSNRETNVAVFEDTARLCKENDMLAKALNASIANQVLVFTDTPIEVDKNRYDYPANIIVSKKRSFEAASAYAKTDSKVCVLNFASATTPGGGVKTGASAQEEALCRISTLYPCLQEENLWKRFYMPHREARNYAYNADAIYTPDVVVFKTDNATPKLMSKDDWYQVDVVTCAAPNLNHIKNSGGKVPSEKELLSIFKERLSRVLALALQNKCDTVILGAFGCGAFGNPPRIVARAAKEVAEEYRYAFKTIEFAVFCTPRDEENYKVFEQTMKNM